MCVHAPVSFTLTSCGTSGSGSTISETSLFDYLKDPGKGWSLLAMFVIKFPSLFLFSEM